MHDINHDRELSKHYAQFYKPYIAIQEELTLLSRRITDSNAMHTFIRCHQLGLKIYLIFRTSEESPMI